MQGSIQDLTFGREVPRAEGHKLPRGGIFLNEYALRCNLVHFEKQF